MPRVMFKEVKSTRTWNRFGRVEGSLPVGLLVEPLSMTPTEVLLIDLSNGCNVIVTRHDFETHFERIS